MSWVVDTCVLLDIALGDPQFGLGSARALDQLRGEGLVACPVTLVEIAPALGGKPARVRGFCDGLGIPMDTLWTPDDTRAAMKAWNAYVIAKRAGLTGKRPIADILIGAFAQQRRGLITRNTAEFRRGFGALPIVDPAKPDKRR
ncbi:MAG: type II toxin-antitoxin system VapC family toxin [Thermoflexales bacterium]